MRFATTSIAVRRLPSSSSHERLRSLPSTATLDPFDRYSSHTSACRFQVATFTKSAPASLAGRSTASRKLATFLSGATSRTSMSVARFPTSATTFTSPPLLTRETTVAAETSRSGAESVANLYAALGVWRSLVARSVRVGEVPSSNLGTPMLVKGNRRFPREKLFDRVRARVGPLADQQLVVACAPEHERRAAHAVEVEPRVISHEGLRGAERIGMAGRPGEEGLRHVGR